MKLLYIFSKKRDFKNISNYPSALYFGYNDFKNNDQFQTNALILSQKKTLYYLWHPIELFLYRITDVGFALDRVIIKLKEINQYDLVIAVNDSSGLPLGLLKILGLVKPKIFMISAGLINNLNKRKRIFLLKPLLSVYKSILKKINLVFFWSDFELGTYQKIIGDNCKFIPLEIDIDFWEPKENVTPGKFILSIGRDIGRDFIVIAKATLLLDIPLIVVTSKNLAIGLDKYPNVTIITDFVSYENLKKLYARAKLVVVGIKENGRISGQTSFIDGMATHKPVIASGTMALLSVYKNTGALFYEPENVYDLANKIEKIWEDESFAKEIISKEVNFLNQVKITDKKTTYKTIEESISLER